MCVVIGTQRRDYYSTNNKKKNKKAVMLTVNSFIYFNFTLFYSHLKILTLSVIFRMMASRYKRTFNLCSKNFG